MVENEEEKPKDDSADKTGESAPPQDKPADSPPKKLTTVQEIREEREKLEKATAAMKIENDRADEMAQHNMLGGSTESGQSNDKKEVDPKEKAKAYGKSIMEGKIPDEE